MVEFNEILILFAKTASATDVFEIFAHFYLLLVLFCILPNTFLSGLCVRTPCLLIDLK